jgi:hypothetical protein
VTSTTFASRRRGTAQVYPPGHSGIDRTKPDVPPWWFPVGGGLEPGETPEAAAIRVTFEPSSSEWTNTESATIRGHRWWSIEELRASTETVFPEDLPDRLARLLGR